MKTAISNKKTSVMKKGTLVLLVLFTFFTTSKAQDNCPCCTSGHKQFDFWIGEWMVYDTLGNKLGENTILKQEKNCLLSEHWKSVRGNTGRSYNYYNKKDSTWNQIWIDSNGGNLVLKGKGGEGKMTLSSEISMNKNRQEIINKITWNKIWDNKVTQTWQVIYPNNKKNQTIFHGIYKRN